MGSVPQTVNKTLGVAESIINDGVMDVIAPIVTQAISSIPQLSFLKIWPLSAILSFAVNWIAQHFSTAMQIVGVKLIITIQTDMEKSAYQKAEGDLRAAILSGNKEAIEKARIASNAAIDSIIHFDGSSPIIT